MRLRHLKLGHALRESSEELLLNRTKSLELISEEGWTSRFIFNEFINQTICDAGKCCLTFLEFVLILHISPNPILLHE